MRGDHPGGGGTGRKASKTAPCHRTSSKIIDQKREDSRIFSEALLKSSSKHPNHIEKPHRKSLIRRGRVPQFFPNPFLKPAASIKTTSKIIDQKGRLPPTFPKPFLRSSLESNLKSSLKSSLESNLKSSLRSSLKSSLKASLKTNLKASLRLFLEGFWYDFLVNYGLIFGVLGVS